MEEEFFAVKRLVRELIVRGHAVPLASPSTLAQYLSNLSRAHAKSAAAASSSQIAGSASSSPSTAAVALGTLSLQGVQEAISAGILSLMEGKGTAKDGIDTRKKGIQTHRAEPGSMKDIEKLAPALEEVPHKKCKETIKKNLISFFFFLFSSSG